MSKHVEKLADEALADMEPHKLEDYDFLMGFQACYDRVAAPLLLALKAAQARLCEHCQQGAEPHVGEHSDECLAALDAIAKAEGA